MSTQGANLKASILLVDDEEFSRKLYSDILTEENYSVKSAKSAEEALEIMGRASFDIMVADFILPQMNGIDLCKKAKSIDPTLDTVIITAHGSMESAIEALKFGIQDYLLKPINPEELKLTIKRLLSLKKVIRENANLRSNNELMKVLNRISLCIEPVQLTEISVNLLSGYMDCKAAFLEFNRANDTFIMKASRGLTKKESTAFQNTVNKLHSGWKRRFLSAKLVKSPLLKMNLKKISAEFSSFLIIPLYIGKSFKGTLVLIRSKRSEKFSQSSLRTAKIIMKHMSATMENCQKFSSAKELAFIDELTGLYNTRYLDYFMEKEIKRARRQSYPLSFLFMDVDKFKHVNDTHGHLVGSRILIEVGKLIKECVRDIDIIVRYGGDEYVIILVNTLPEGAHLVGDRLRQRIQDHVFMQREKLNIKVTASFGIATYPIHAESKEEVVDLADKAMYKAKTTSRNAVYVISEIV